MSWAALSTTLVGQYVASDLSDLNDHVLLGDWVNLLQSDVLMGA